MPETLTIDLATVADGLQLASWQVENTVGLLDEGNTVAFITRYRKERTGTLNEEQIRAIQKEVHVRRQVAERAEAILRLIDAQGKLTEDLRLAILQADSLKRLEDLYLPFRPKRQSRATQARERGLEPLADAIWSGGLASDALAAKAGEFVDEANGVADADAALAGAQDILAEWIGEDADFRQAARQIAWRTGKFVVAKAKVDSDGEKDKPESQEYRDYYEYSEAASRVPPHRLLAVNRGEKAGALKVKVEWQREQAVAAMCVELSLEAHPCGEFLRRCVIDALERFVAPALEREIRRESTEAAEEHAVEVFARNLRNLLLQPPLRGKRVVAVDPGFRTGCKVAILDEFGNCLKTDVVYVTGSEEKRVANIEKLAQLIREHGGELVAIGNGTACRETEELVSDMIAKLCPDVHYVIVNEAGASIYSTSGVAREEFPDQDATVRGTISIGRRLIDPLSELVKIDPQHLGVGLYQHDVTPKLLQESLEEVVESCVNYVGVDLNTASVSLLRRVSGLNQLIARRMIEKRKELGRFSNRHQLLEIPGIGEATFTQAAGFLKLTDGDQPLDATWIHPESYDAARRLLESVGIAADEILQKRELQERLASVDKTALALELGISELAISELIAALTRPGRDPRGESPDPVFKQGILKLEDLQAGMELTGTVLNVVDFGAFVDVGLKDSGLIHISQLSSGYIKSPHDAVSVGDVVRVWVLSIDNDRKRVALTRIPPGTEREKRPERRTRRPRTRGTERNSKPAATASPAVAAPLTAMGNESSNDVASVAPKPKSDRPKRKRRRKSSSSKEVLPHVEEGQTLRGFDELKALWHQTRQKPK